MTSALSQISHRTVIKADYPRNIAAIQLARYRFRGLVQQRCWRERRSEKGLSFGGNACVAQSSSPKYTLPQNTGGPNDETDEDHVRTSLCRDSGRRDANTGAGRRCHLLQLSAAMGRLGLDAQGDQGRPRLRHPLRQQEFRPDAVAAARREEQPGRRHRLLRRQLRHEGKEPRAWSSPTSRRAGAMCPPV